MIACQQLFEFLCIDLFDSRSFENIEKSTIEYFWIFRMILMKTQIFISFYGCFWKLEVWKQAHKHVWLFYGV